MTDSYKSCQKQLNFPVTLGMRCLVLVTLIGSGVSFQNAYNSLNQLNDSSKFSAINLNNTIASLTAAQNNIQMANYFIAPFSILLLIILAAHMCGFGLRACLGGSKQGLFSGSPSVQAQQPDKPYQADASSHTQALL